MPQHGYARRLKDTLQKAFDVARRNLNTNTERMKDFYDQKIHGKPYTQVTWCGYITLLFPKENPGSFILPGRDLIRWLNDSLQRCTGFRINEGVDPEEDVGWWCILIVLNPALRVFVLMTLIPMTSIVN